MNFRNTSLFNGLRISARLLTPALLAGSIAVQPLVAHDHHHHHAADCCAVDGGYPAADHHAPAGIMGDHAHPKGGIMVGYMYMYQPTSGLRAGSTSVAESALPHLGYSAAPVEMDMHMHMLHIMYAPADWVTLMVVPQYMKMDMTMRMLGGGHGGHGGAPGMAGMTHRHTVEGWNDTLIAGIFPLWSRPGHQIVGQLGLSIPTGDVGIRNAAGAYTHYGMQIGSGTWDARPGLTYRGSAGRLGWGAQGQLTLRLEDENDSGYQLGNIAELTGWLSWRLRSWASVSGRLNYRHEGHLAGHYNGPHSHSSPADLQANYGGEVLEAGAGVNIVIPGSFLKGNCLGLELLLPIYEDYRGIQLGRDFTLNFSWSKGF